MIGLEQHWHILCLKIPDSRRISEGLQRNHFVLTWSIEKPKKFSFSWGNWNVNKDTTDIFYGQCQQQHIKWFSLRWLWLLILHTHVPLLKLAQWNVKMVLDNIRLIYSVLKFKQKIKVLLVLSCWRKKKHISQNQVQTVGNGSFFLPSFLPSKHLTLPTIDSNALGDWD